VGKTLTCFIHTNSHHWIPTNHFPMCLTSL
jgi:hypothetical protein